MTANEAPIAPAAVGKHAVETGEGADTNMQSLQQINQMLTLENERLKAALLNIQENLANSVQRTTATLEDSADINSSLKNLVNEANVIKENVGFLSDKASNSKAKLERLTAEMVMIKTSLQEIISISQASKVLALNATIEAARAGEAGKSFAVVATEVKQLSDKTRQASINISKALAQVEESSTDVEDVMADFFERTNDANKTMDEFYQSLAATIASNDASTLHIHETNDLLFMSLAKLDHVLWKINTYLSVLNGKPELTFVDHHNCRLGKWFYEGAGSQHFSHLPGYFNLEGPHAMTHNGTKKVLDELKKAKADLQTMAAGLEEMERGSQGVFDHLDRILEAKQHS